MQASLKLFFVQKCGASHLFNKSVKLAPQTFIRSFSLTRPGMLVKASALAFLSPRRPPTYCALSVWRWTESVRFNLRLQKQTLNTHDGLKLQTISGGAIKLVFASHKFCFTFLTFGGKRYSKQRKRQSFQLPASFCWKTWAGSGAGTAAARGTRSPVKQTANNFVSYFWRLLIMRSVVKGAKNAQSWWHPQEQ